MGSRRIHAYAASFGDDLAEQLILQNTEPGTLILDPFSGAATSLIQAKLLGRSATGIDVDPIACLIAKVVTQEYPHDELEELTAFGSNGIEEASVLAGKIMSSDPSVPAGSSFCFDGYRPFVPRNDSIEFWFHPIQRAVLAALMAVIGATQNQRLQAVQRLAISASIVHKWPHTISLARDIDHSRPHRTERQDVSVESQLRTFKRCVMNVVGVLKGIESRAANSDCVYEVVEGDACEKLNLLEPSSIDYVLTSPPYFDAIDYPRAHKFSGWWLWPDRQISNTLYLGLKPGGRMSREGSIPDETLRVPESAKVLIPSDTLSGALYMKLARYLIDLDKVIGGLRRVIRCGGSMDLIVANNVIREVELPVVEIIRRLLETSGFRDLNVTPRMIDCRRRRYPYGIRGFKGLMNAEYIISATKP